MSVQVELKTSEVLDLAADLIEQRGWIKATWNNAQDDKPLCVEGAIAAAMGMTDVDLGGSGSDEEYESLQSCPAYQAVRAHVIPESDHLYWWNDTPGRTGEQVVSTLREVAEIQRQKEIQK